MNHLCYEYGWIITTQESDVIPDEIVKAMFKASEDPDMHYTGYKEECIEGNAQGHYYVSCGELENPFTHGNRFPIIVHKDASEHYKSRKAIESIIQSVNLWEKLPPERQLQVHLGVIITER